MVNEISDAKRMMKLLPKTHIGLFEVNFRVLMEISDDLGDTTFTDLEERLWKDLLLHGLPVIRLKTEVVGFSIPKDGLKDFAEKAVGIYEYVKSKGLPIINLTSITKKMSPDKDTKPK